ARLLDAALLTSNALDAARDSGVSAVFEMFQLATDLGASRRVPINSELPGEVMFSSAGLPDRAVAVPELLQPISENPRVKQIAGKIRTPTDQGQPVPKMKAFN